jgi:ubiquinone biosynthesis protein COQ9
MALSSRDLDQRRALTAAALAHVPFDGWSMQALNAGAGDLGLADGAAARLFPDGPSEVLSQALDEADQAMLDALKGRDLGTLKIRDRIALAVRLRIEADLPHREAAARAAAYLALPSNHALAARRLYATVDAMWRGIGDTSVDFNFYTKRALLAGVVSSTVLYWLQDQSDGFEETWSFLDRRIGNVMKIQQARGLFERAAQRLPLFRKFIGGA